MTAKAQFVSTSSSDSSTTPPHRLFLHPTPTSILHQPRTPALALQIHYHIHLRTTHHGNILRVALVALPYTRTTSAPLIPVAHQTAQSRHARPESLQPPCLQSKTCRPPAVPTATLSTPASPLPQHHRMPPMASGSTATLSLPRRVASTTAGKSLTPCHRHLASFTDLLSASTSVAMSPFR